MTASTESSTQSHHDEKEAIAPARLVAYALGNFGQSAFYNALSTYFVVYVTNSLFSGVDKAVAGKLIGIITSLIVIIRIAEIFVDPLLATWWITPPPNSGDSALGSSSAVWCPPC